ncbi:zinc finger protein ZFP2-like isoform X2 [Ochotona princeps]|uniref:zinc finger protein ZFP2-like isoform X2 n=1 Tax=Ochotona princeps TaxID=9978 RepID=UPI002715008F|nr:zinc finger protein ZFP2-like isoform X2 [Ochotona princeps]
MNTFPVLVSFEDVLVDFTQEEWQGLNSVQRTLYRDVMLETYSSLLSLGFCITKPEVIFKLEQGLEPWTIEEALNWSLPVAKKIDVIKASKKNQDGHLRQVVTTDNISSIKNRVELRKTLNLRLNRVVKNGSYQGMMPEAFNIYQKGLLPNDPVEVSGAQSVIARKSLQRLEHQSQCNQIQALQWDFGCSGQDKACSREEVSFICKRVHVKETSCANNQHVTTCDKSVLIADGTALIGKQTQCKKVNLCKRQITHERKSPYECECGKTFMFKSYFIRHQKSHAGKKAYESQQSTHPGRKLHDCGKAVCSQVALTIHQGFHTRKKCYQCSTCGMAFYKKLTLRRHRVSHIGRELYECSECGKGFHQKSVLTFHQRIHAGGVCYKFNEYRKACYPKLRPGTRKRTHADEKIYTCEECGKGFYPESALVVHQRTHTEEKPYECEDCGKIFDLPSVLAIHQRTHTGEKPFKCSECGRLFSRKGDLSIHERTHTGEKAYECKACGRPFYRKSHLIEHHRSHTGEKPYQCNACGKAFIRKSHLKRHQTTQTGKPYECDKCGETFCQKSHFKTHQKVHTSKYIHECEECGQPYSKRSHLKRHQAIHRRKAKSKANNGNLLLMYNELQETATKSHE